MHKYQISLQNFNLILCLLHFLDVGFFQSHEPWDTRAHSLIRTASKTYEFSFMLKPEISPNLDRENGSILANGGDRHTFEPCESPQYFPSI